MIETPSCVASSFSMAAATPFSVVISLASLTLLTWNPTTGSTVQQRKRAHLCGAVADVRDIGEPHRTPAAGRDRDVANLLDRDRGAENAQRLFATAYRDAATRRVETGDRQRLAHVVRSQSLRGQSIGVHDDVDLAIHAAHPSDLRNAGRGLQRAGNGVFDEPRQFLYRHAPAPTRHT